ncbi:hypothetical protein OAC78_08260 [Litorivicinus sp.]|nr:hypothetical protein [Litorivicinus sp.]
MRVIGAIILGMVGLFGLISLDEKWQFFSGQDAPITLSSEYYWGSNCFIDPKGYLTCETSSGDLATTCLSQNLAYRLKTNVENPYSQPISLEVWDTNSPQQSTPKKPIKTAFGEVVGAGTGLCYSEEYLFPELGMSVYRKWGCFPDTDPPKRLANLMFYMRTHGGDEKACIAINTQKMSTP